MGSPLHSNSSLDTEEFQSSYEIHFRTADSPVSSPNPSPVARSEDSDIPPERDAPGPFALDEMSSRQGSSPGHAREDLGEEAFDEGLGDDVPRGPTHGVRPLGLKYFDVSVDSPPVDRDVLDLAKRSFIPLPLNASLSKLPPGASEREAACIPRIHFQYGLSLPFPPLFLEILTFYKIAPAQMHPNGVALILAFLLNCARCAISPTLLLFRSFYALRKAHASFPGVFSFNIRSGIKDFLLSKPRSAKGYLSKGFFLCDSRVYPMPAWNDSILPEDKKPLSNLPAAVASDHSFLRLSPLDMEVFYKSGNAGYFWPRGIYPSDLFTLPRISAVWPDGGAR